MTIQNWGDWVPAEIVDLDTDQEPLCDCGETATFWCLKEAVILCKVHSHEDCCQVAPSNCLVRIQVLHQIRPLGATS